MPAPSASPLPLRLTPLVGRDDDLADAEALLRSARLLTLTGVGGVGKTSLALELARADGGEVWFVELATVPRDPAAALAETIGVRPLPGEDELGAVARYLSTRTALVVLDNCEHLLDPCAAMATAVLEAADGVRILATSRAPLGVPGELDRRVPPLEPAAARRLFVERAAQVFGSGSLTRADDDAIAGICRGLDGVPLAIELAVGRLRVLSAGEIADRLDDAVRLAGGGRASLPRHRAMQASVEWSHDLLPDDARRLYRRLGVFAGPFELERVQQVCADEKLLVEDVLDAVSVLAEHSLVHAASAHDGRSRHRLLEMVRQDAVRRLAESGEEATVRARHRDVYVALVEQHRAVVTTPDQPAALRRIDAEAPDVLGALEHALASDPALALRACAALVFWFRHRGRSREGVAFCTRALAAPADAPERLRNTVRAVGAMMSWMAGDFVRGSSEAQASWSRGEELGDDEGAAIAMMTVCDTVTHAAPGTAIPVMDQIQRFAERTGADWLVAHTLMMRACVAWFEQDLDVCRSTMSQSLAIAERIGDRDTIGTGEFMLAAVHWGAGDLDRIEEHAARALRSADAIDQPLIRQLANLTLCCVRIERGDSTTALEGLREVETETLARGGVYFASWIFALCGIADAAGDDLSAAAARLRPVADGEVAPVPTPIALAAVLLAEVLRLQRDPGAMDRATAAHHAADAANNPWFRSKAALTLARLHLTRGEVHDAAARAHDALADVARSRSWIELAPAFETLAEVNHAQGRLTDAARLLGAAERSREELGTSPWPARSAELDPVRERLAAADVGTAFDDGRAADRDAAIGWARRGRGVRRRALEGWDSLTPAEIEVARHVLAGRSNPEIAEHLFVSRATVKTHLSHAYSKLGIRGRVELARMAAERL